ncbi:unnamed protein product [Rodentolepis nana]|uniref:Uncharacterized protein n=1 Tax=Rodentolepis nana TaxID=102285 RepID=A0A0R3T3W4_RODNA|nr:unnamed protein product [Rodentolepis nana]
MDDTRSRTNKLFSCCKNRNACNADLKMNDSAQSNAFSLIKRSENPQGQTSYQHELDFNVPKNWKINSSFGPEILIRNGSNSIPDNFHKFSDQNSPHNQLNGFQILSIFVPSVIMIGIIAIFLLTKCTLPISFPKKYRKWKFCFTSVQSKVSIDPSSVASTRSTNLQDSQSFSSSQIARSKVQQGRILIHKLENVKFLSENHHSLNFTAIYEEEPINLRLLPPANSSRSLMLWKRLVGIHERCVLRHSNLSGITAADVCLLSELRRSYSENRPLSSTWFSPNTICAFTVEEYHPWGSFTNILLQNSQMGLPSSIRSSSHFALCVIRGIVNGVTFLHTVPQETYAIRSISAFEMNNSTGVDLYPNVRILFMVSRDVD